MEEPLDHLVYWYATHCDGDWEHSSGISIETLDNPGWSVRIDLKGTELEGRSFEREEIHRSADDWVVRWVQEAQYCVACGPRNLTEALAGFSRWAG